MRALRVRASLIIRVNCSIHHVRHPTQLTYLNYPVTSLFKHEGDEIRTWLQGHVPDNFFVVCGDRHWQYHSVHPSAGVQEFSVGPASNSHASGSPGEDKTYHRFHRVKGGFLCVELRPNGAESEIAFQLRGVDGAVGYEAKFKRPVA